MMLPRSIASTLAVLLTAGALAAQQAPPPAPQRPDPQMPPITFRAEVNYVEVDAVVRDAQGSFVRTLAADDFQVFEDGVQQSVTAFSLVDIPVVRAERALFSPRDIEPDVRSNAAGPGGRLYVLLLDDLHTAFQRSPRVRQTAKQFIERYLGANDLMAVLHTSGRTDAAQDFTSSRRLLEAAVDKFMGRKLRSAFLNKMDIYTRNRATGSSNAILDSEDAERLYQARSMLGTLKSLSDWLAGIRGRRKAVVLLGEGVDYNIFGTASTADSTPGSSSSQTESSDSGSATSTSTTSRSPTAQNGNRGDGLMLLSESQDAINAATRANVSIYAIDPRGLAVPEEDMISMIGIVPDDPSYGLRSTDLADELRIAQNSLRTLAGETGGFASVNANDVTPALERIVDENSTYYVLGYYPTNEKRDGRFRRIEVRVKQPGLVVRARRGYAGPSGSPKKDRKVEASAGTSPELRAALDNPIESSDFRFSLFAAPLRGPGRKAAIAIVSQFEGRDIGFTRAGAQHANALEISYVAVNRQGKVAGGNRERIDLSLKPETYARVLAAGFRVQSRLELAPGDYQLRVAARESGGKIGSVHYDLSVPDFGRYLLGMSGVFLTSMASGAVPSAGAIPDIGEMLPSPPTTARTFRRPDELALLAEIYDNDTRSHSMDITTSLRAEGSVPVYSTTETRSSKELGGKKGGYGFTAKIPLAGFAPGLYVLKIEAKSTLSDVGSVMREVQIRIVE